MVQLVFCIVSSEIGHIIEAYCGTTSVLYCIFRNQTSLKPAVVQLVFVLYLRKSDISLKPAVVQLVFCIVSSEIRHIIEACLVQQVFCIVSSEIRHIIEACCGTTSVLYYIFRNQTYH